jgi:hypothetical protein
MLSGFFSFPVLKGDDQMEQHSKAYERRYIRALEIVEAGAARRNGADGAFYVKSQSGPWTYDTQSRRVTDGVPVCSCPDEDGRKAAGACKHVLACEIFESAEQYAHKLKEVHGLTWSQLEGHIVADLCHYHPKVTSLRLGALLETVRRLGGRDEDEDEPGPDEIALTVRYMTDGSARFPVMDGGELLQMQWNGADIKPVTRDLHTLYRWIASKGFEPHSFRWIEPPSYVRRRKQVYRKAS